MLHAELQPSPQEELLIAIHQRNFDVAIGGVMQILSRGDSPSVLSVVQGEIYLDFAEEWMQSFGQANESPIGGPTLYKNDLFRMRSLDAAGGDPAAVSLLPKFATTSGQLSLAASVALDNRRSLVAYREGTAYLQYLASFDPQHVGHRVAIGASTEAAATDGNKAHALVHIMGDHPRKTFHAPYTERYAESEGRLYASPWLNPEAVTQVDIPGGRGLAVRDLSQMSLLADVVGDPALRWVIGSDKLLLDADTVQNHPEKAAKAAARFADPRMHIYVVHRQNDNSESLQQAADYVRNRYATAITLVEEWPYDCAPASSSQVRNLRAAGRNQEADRMELYEIL